MKAPETILLHGYSFDDEPCKNWTTEPLKNGLRSHTIQYEKYISQGSLLSKLTERMEQAKVDAGGCSNMHASGKYIAYQEVIDLINEL